MNDDIKEIIVKLKEHLRYQKEVADVDNDVAYLKLTIRQYKLLLDYITNLKQENERLKETNVYCNRTDCVGRIKDSKKYDSVYQEKEDYKSRCEKAVEYLKNNCYIGNCINTYEAIDITNVMDILNGRSDE